MARWGAIPSAFGRIHPRFLTPSFSTLLMGGLSILWTIALLAFNPNQDVLGDTISALGFAVCFYYGCTGIACAFYYRRELFRRARTFFFAGLIPLIGGLMLIGVGVKAFDYYSTAGNNYAKPLLGIQVPIVVGIGGLIVGVILMFAAWPFFPQFFQRRAGEAVDPAVLAGERRPAPVVPE
jgi:amino acid transporter